MKKNLAIIATVVFIISYFLPFISLMGVSVSLFTILTTSLQMGVFALDIIAFILAFVLAVIGLVMVFMGKGVKVVMFAGILGLVACLLEVIVGGGTQGLDSLGVSIFQILGFGFWLTAIASIGMIASGVVKNN